MGRLQPGIAHLRAWVFDVAPEILGTVTSMTFRVWAGDPRLDSRLVIDIPLENPEVRRSSVVTVPATVLEAS